MKTISTPNLSTCGRCHQTKPVTDFYVSQRTLLPDNYCRACRTEIQRARYLNRRIANLLPPSVPLIVETEDRETRMALIRHARQVVKESVERKRRNDREKEESLFI